MPFEPPAAPSFSQANNAQPVQSNAEVAARFTELADSLELMGENAFKVRAYRNAAHLLEEMPESIALVAAENRLDALTGFGEAIQAKTRDILATGTTKALEAVRAQVPSTLLELVSLPGVGSKTVRQLHQSLGVDSLAALEQAIEEQRVRALPGFGEKTEAKLKDAIERHRRYSKRLLLSDARALGKSLLDALAAHPEVDKIAQAGSARRGVETVGDINIVAISSHPHATMEAFTALPQVARILAQGDHSARLVLNNGFEADLKLAAPGEFGPLLLYFTGSNPHNIRLRDLAEQRGLKINEYGVFRLDNGERIVSGDDELSIYAALGLPPIPAPLREDRGEIEAALANRLPRLLQISDIRGDLHAHTEASDGSSTIEQMARAAQARGYEYCAITDHSQSLTVASGLPPERLREQIKAVRDTSQRLGFAILTGAECDIKSDGSMDFPDDLLAELDFVIGSVHSRFSQPEDIMTARIIRAIENPNVDMIAHPTGRLLNQRDPYAVNMEAVIEAAARTQTALEINSWPERQDLNDIHARMACQAGVKLIVNTDAHAPEHYNLIEYGINVAQRAWLEPSDILNTLPLSDLMAWLRRKPSGLSGHLP